MGMMMMIMYYRKQLIRYLSFSNPHFHSSSSSSSSPLNIYPSHQTNKTLIKLKPSPSHYSVTSTSSLSIIRSSTGYYRYPTLSRIGLLRLLYSPFRWFSASSSLGSLSSTSLENALSEKTSLGFENMAELTGDPIVNGLQSNMPPSPRPTATQVSEIIEVIRSGESNLDSRLNLMMTGGLTLSVNSFGEIFRVLNRERISALHFFQWVRRTQPQLYHNSNLCSLIIDNCGWLDDYGTMVYLLKDFTSKRICLTEKAFEFLPVLGSSKASLMDSIRILIETLNEVGGSCRGSGIWSLIVMLCELDSFEMAKFVIEITERKVLHYNILIRKRCSRCHYDKAHGLIEEMRELGCDPNAKTYNYLLSSLCKSGRTSEAGSVLEEMLEKGTPPDAVTFEIFIYYSCRLGKLDDANQFLDRMVTSGFEPRLTTHAAFVKGYFYARQYEEAHKYVHDSSVRHMRSCNTIYSLLASLHLKNGDLIVARNILIEMMEKSLKPYFPVYRRLMLRLLKTGRGHLARDLKSRFSRFRVEPSTTVG